MLAARISKDKDHCLLFAGGAGRNELRVFDNDSEGTGTYKNMAYLNEQRGSILCLDTAKNGPSEIW